jgi:peptide/nickel transport system substrate-binding protein
MVWMGMVKQTITVKQGIAQEKAKDLLKEAGQENLELEFNYPTDVSRPYMPDPQANFEAMVQDLEDCCFTVQEESATWSPDYLGRVDTGKYASYLLGWTGDFADPDNFIGTFFQDEQPAWAHGNREIYEILDRAETETDLDAREELYQEPNRIIMEELPGLPYVHTKPGLAFTANVTGYKPSPGSLEPFSIVTVE